MHQVHKCPNKDMFIVCINHELDSGVEQLLPMKVFMESLNS